MAKTIYYIDLGRDDGPTGILFSSPNTTAVYTGLEIHTEEKDPLLEDIARLCGIRFFCQKPELSLYGVPYLTVFASDGAGGYFACGGDMDRSPAVHIAPDFTVTPVADSFAQLMELACRDPDWRAGCLPGQWPVLPEDPAGRKKLEGIMWRHPSAGTPRRPPLPLRVFASRAEAEAHFPIQDLWTVLREKREPRFQVHTMMSPQDREGRALVHYQAWQETYTGLMDAVFLEAHTLEHCRKMAERGGGTFVALDRADGDRVVGFGTLSYYARASVSVPEAGEITALYVLREFQGLGLGRQLLEHCLAWIHRPRAVLFVLKGNDKAIGFYEHMGFCLTGHEITERQKGREITEVEMCLEIDRT